MEELDHKESWALKSWCFWTVESEKTCESHLGCKEFQPVNPKGNQSWIFIERTDAEAEALILWPPFAKNWLIRKDPVAQHIGLKSGWHTVWGKETRDRIEDLKMGMENSRPSESRALFFRDTSLLFSVLACRKYLLCHNKINLLCPWSHLSFYWLFWAVFVMFLYKIIGPNMPWENILVCAEAAFWTFTDQHFKVHTLFP